jgi:hypothetical protein
VLSGDIRRLSAGSKKQKTSKNTKANVDSMAAAPSNKSKEQTIPGPLVARKFLEIKIKAMYRMEGCVGGQNMSLMLSRFEWVEEKKKSVVCRDGLE